MTSALDQFGESLVRASRTLHRQNHAGAAAGGHASARPASRLRALLPRRAWRIPAAALLFGALAAAGTSLLGPTGNPRYIAQFVCGNDVTESVSGEPLRDCATLWPSLYHHPAPSLVAWVSETGGAVVVTPAGHPPAGGRWRRLPVSWSADAAVLGLHFQLEDITTGIEARRCWSARAASALVSSILRADGLGSWQVQVKTASADHGQPNCLSVAPVTGAGPHSVLLVERLNRQPADVNSLWPSGLAEHVRLTSTETRVNHELDGTGRCASVARAAALWRSSARIAHIPDGRYVLFMQAARHGAVTACARVFINTPGGGGPADVYAAELP